MLSPKRRVHVTPGFGHALLLTAAAVLAAACTGSTATNPAVASVAAATATSSATDTPIATATPTPTDTPAATATPTPTAGATPTNGPTTAPTKAPTAKPTPTQNPLAIGLCPAKQLKLTITSWQNSGDSYAHVTATNVSSASCNMRGSSRAQVLDGHGKLIADAGSAAAKVAQSDPVYPLAPNGTINTIVDWGNWCTTAPAQNVTVQMVLAFGLGTIKAAPIGAAPIPSCYVSSQRTSLSSEPWLP